MNNPFPPISWTWSDPVDSRLVVPRQVHCKPATAGGVSFRSFEDFAAVPFRHRWVLCPFPIHIIGSNFVTAASAGQLVVPICESFDLPEVVSGASSGWSLGVVSRNDPLLLWYVFTSQNVTVLLLSGFCCRGKCSNKLHLPLFGPRLYLTYLLCSLATVAW